MGGIVPHLSQRCKPNSENVMDLSFYRSYIVVFRTTVLKSLQWLFLFKGYSHKFLTVFVLVRWDGE